MIYVIHIMYATPKCLSQTFPMTSYYRCTR